MQGLQAWVRDCCLLLRTGVPATHPSSSIRATNSTHRYLATLAISALLYKLVYVILSPVGKLRILQVGHRLYCCP